MGGKDREKERKKERNKETFESRSNLFLEAQLDRPTLILKANLRGGGEKASMRKKERKKDTKEERTSNQRCNRLVFGRTV
mgnify:CR=1 FL=1